MRKIILAMNTTIDGIVTDELSWMQPDTDQTRENFFEMLANVDLLLLGGGMWTDYKNHWKRALSEPGFSQNEIKYARYAERTKHIIFSSTLKDADWANATIESGDLKKIILGIKSESGKDVQIVGGKEFASSVINTGLVDEYRIMMNPVLVGKGKSLYDNLITQHKLKCVKTELMDNGVVILTYKAI